MHRVGWTLTVFFKLVDFQTNFRYNFIIILQYGGEKKLKKNVTLKDVAKLAGVSTAAASKALRGEKDIGPETRARVEKIAESLGYCTNNLAIYLRNGSIKALGVVMPDSFNPYNALVLQGVEEKAKELGYNVIIGNTNCDRALERDLLKSFVSMKVSGILAIPSWLENYKTIPLPLIIMSRFPYMEPYASKAHAILRPDVQYIVNDDFSGQYLAVEHLIQRGFRNNYLIIGSTEPDSAEGVMNLMRKDGYRKALADAGIAFAEDHVIENVRSIHESYRVVTQLLKSGAGRIGLCMNMDPGPDNNQPVEIRDRRAERHSGHQRARWRRTVAEGSEANARRPAQYIKLIRPQAFSEAPRPVFFSNDYRCRRLHRLCSPAATGGNKNGKLENADGICGWG